MFPPLAPGWRRSARPPTGLTGATMSTTRTRGWARCTSASPCETCWGRPSSTGATSVLHAPAFGMMGFPGLDAVFCARAGLRVGLLDYDGDRLEAVRAQWAELCCVPDKNGVHADAGSPVAQGAVPVRAQRARPRPRRRHVCGVGAWAASHRDRVDRHPPVPGHLRADRQDPAAWRRCLPLRGPLGPRLPLRRPLGPRLGQGLGVVDRALSQGRRPHHGGPITRLASWERFVPGPVAPALAHHRWHLFERANDEVPA